MLRRRGLGFCLLGVFIGLQACAEKETMPLIPISFGCAKEPLSLLVLVARHEGFFEEEGLDVQFTDYASGKLALSALLDGEVLCAVTSEVPVVFQSFTRSNFRMVSTIGRSANEPRIVARKDRGIFLPQDLKGKKIGTQRASAVHFFLSLFLMQNGISEDEVSIVFMAGKDLPEALANGEIDAFSMREPFVTQAKAELQGHVVVFEAPGLYQKTFILALNEHVVDEQPVVVEKLLKALIKAEAFVNTQPDQANAIGATFLHVRKEDFAAVVSELNLRLLIDQALILSLEDEARWVIQENLLEGKQMPNFLALIDQSALKETRPQMATVIH